MKNQYPYRGPLNQRFERPDSNKEIVNPYDLDSKLFQDLAQRKINPVFVTTIDLRTAGQLSLPKPGFHFVIYGHDGSATKTVNTTVLVSAIINNINDDGSTPFPAKHARGFSGPFHGLWLSWTAQANAYADVLVFLNPDKPWIDGESAT